MRHFPKEKRARQLNSREKDLLKLASGCEPQALMLDDANLIGIAEDLVAARFLGKVEIRGETAFRLTDFGRAALAPPEPAQAA